MWIEGSLEALLYSYAQEEDLCAVKKGSRSEESDKIEEEEYDYAA